MLRRRRALPIAITFAGLLPAGAVGAEEHARAAAAPIESLQHVPVFPYSPAGTRLVIAYDFEVAWLDGRIRRTGRSSDRVVGIVPMHAERVPAAARAFVGRRFRVYAGAAQRCEVRIDRIEGALYWDNIYRLPRLTGEGPPAGRDARIMADLWALMRGWADSRDRPDRFLIAHGVRESGNCHGADWARDSTLPVPSLYPARIPRGPWRAAAIKAFRRLEVVRATQARWQKERTADGPLRFDADLTLPGNMDIRMVEEPGRRRFHIFTQVPDGCGDDIVTVVIDTTSPDPRTAAFTVALDTTKVLDADEARASCPDCDDLAWCAWYDTPLGSGDIDGDGIPELLVPRGYLRDVKGGQMRLHSFDQHMECEAC